MPIEMPQGLPFSVDTWTPSSKSSKRHHFLTHAHKDHSSNITSHSSFPIYSTLLTKTLLLQHYPLLHDSLFYQIEVGQSLIIHDPDGDFSVTAFDANHCPGAVMFLFEGQFGNILHTGDCRLSLECLLSLPHNYVGRKGKKPACSLDCVFLDSTFANFSRPMPTKRSSIQQKTRRPYEKECLDTELKLVDEYGLRCKRDLWRVHYALSRTRNNSRNLLTLDEKSPHRIFEGEALLRRMFCYGLLDETQNKLEYVLSLTVQNFLECRL